jgi:hypothetical protein
MAIGQNPQCHQRRIFQLINAKREVDALGDLVHDPFRDEDLDMDIRVFLLKSDDDRREQ